MTVAERIVKEIVPLLQEINKTVDLPSGQKVKFALNFIKECVHDKLELLKQEEPTDE